MLRMFAVLLVAIATRAEAQTYREQGGSNSIGAGLMVGRSIVRDEAVGSSTFKGLGVGAQIRYEHVSGLYSFAFEGLGFSGTLSPDKANDVSVASLTARGDILGLRSLGASTKLHTSLGLGLGASFANRSWNGLLNVSTSRDWMAYLSVAGQISYVFLEGDHGWSLSDRFIFPVVAGSKRTFRASGSTEYPDGDGSAGLEWKAIGGFLSILNRISLRHSFNDRHSLALEYVWNYHALGGSEPVMRADHGFGLTYAFQF